MRMLLPLVIVLVATAIVLLITRSPRRSGLEDGGWAPAVEDDRPGSGGWARAIEDAQVPADPRTESVERARERLGQAEARYAARLAAAEEALARARQDPEVLRLGSVVLGRCTVLVAGREHELSEGTRFTFEHEGRVAYRVDEAGDSSRIVADDRRLGRLTVEGDGWVDGVDVIPADFAEAERLVAAGEAAIRSLPAARRDQAARVERTWAELEAARVDRTEVDEARLTLEDILGAGPSVWDVPEPPEDERGA